MADNDPVQELHIPPQAMSRFIRPLGEKRVTEVLGAGERLRAALGGRSVWNVNSTAMGGGVAEMIRPLLAYARGAGLEARWLVIQGNPAFFQITKRVHNAIHGDRGDGSALGTAEREAYEHTLRTNGDALLNRVKKGDVVLLHDPQTAGLAPMLSQAGVHVVWRSHIGTDGTNAETERGWHFLQPYLQHARALVFSRAAYVPAMFKGIPTAIIQPSIDPFSTKNQELSEDKVREILGATGLVGAPRACTTVSYPRSDGTLGEVRHAAEVIRLGGPPTFEAPLIVQVSRWDLLKDPKGVMEGFAELAQEGGAANAELMLMGPGFGAVADDPDGERIFSDLMISWRKLPHEIRRRVHLASIPTTDGDENAIIVNALQRHAAIVVQKSLQEGFGLTVTEAMWKARPVVATRVGGIQDQITDGVDGLLLDDPSDLEGFGQLLGKLLHDPELAKKLGAQAQVRAREEFLGVRHLMQYATLLERLLH
ncbi:MAG: glycosyltransferase [Deltaproteobacteria bacterium]|nr:glycosyltransferase [Deltaproteobacteria bacterium]